jgi:hypothetical protein
MWVFNNSVNVVEVVNHINGNATNVTGVVAVVNGGTGVTTSTGSGNVVLSNSPTLVTPALGTPASATLTNATGLPIDGGTTGTLPVARGGTGAATLTVNNVIIGNGTSTVGFVAPGTSGNVLTSNGTTWTSAPGAGGGGTVTSVGFSGGTTGLTVSGSPITSSGTITLAGTLAIANGGTGSTSDSGARSSLGLGSMATQASNNVSITGGSISGISGLAATGSTNTFTQNQTINKGSGTSVLFMGGSTFGMQFTHTGSSLEIGRISGPFISFTSADITSSTDQVFKPTAGSWLGSSDQRLKENIVDYTKGLPAIKSLRPVNFQFKDEIFWGNTSLAQQTNYKVCTGLIAQEVEETELANMVADGLNGYKTLDVSEITYALVNAVKELSTRLEAAEAEIATLKG